MPTPRQNETRDQFMNRCISVVMNNGTAQNVQQAYEICQNIYNRSNKATVKINNGKRK